LRDRYAGERNVQAVSSPDQFLCMAFAQLTCRESLRDIEPVRAPSARCRENGRLSIVFS